MDRITVYLTIVLAAVLLPFATAGGQALVIDPPPIAVDPRIVDVPGDEFSTIQSAVEALPTGSTIRLESGRYTESITIAGKVIDIVGRRGFGGRRSVIQGSDPGRAVITFGPGGGGTVSRLALRGGAFGIQGVRQGGGTGRDALPAPVTVRRTRISRTGQGIFGCFSQIRMQGISVARTDWNGICILESEVVEMQYASVANTPAVGLLVFNADNTEVLVEYAWFWKNRGGGLAVVGGQYPVTVNHCWFSRNGIAGIFLSNVGDAWISNTYVYFTYSVDQYWTEFGDGLIAYSDTIPGNVNLDNCGFGINERAGILYVNTGGTIADTFASRNLMGLVVQGDTHPYLVSDGNVFQNNIEDNIASDGDLAVPDTALSLPDAPL